MILKTRSNVQQWRGQSWELSLSITSSVVGRSLTTSTKLCALLTTYLPSIDFGKGIFLVPPTYLPRLVNEVKKRPHRPSEKLLPFAPKMIFRRIYY